MKAQSSEPERANTRRRPPLRKWDPLATANGELAIVMHMMGGGEILPSQLPSHSNWTPEKHLAAAVFASGLIEIRDRRRGGKNRLHVAEAVAWVFSNAKAWPYSFLRLCDVFGLDSTWVREVVQRWLQEPAESGYQRAA